MYTRTPQLLIFLCASIMLAASYRPQSSLVVQFWENEEPRDPAPDWEPASIYQASEQ